MNPLDNCFQAVIFGNPQPDPRPRATNRGDFINIYKSYNEKTKDWLHAIDNQLCSKVKKFNGPVKVFLDFYLPRPQTRKKEKWVSVKPDIDNLAKLVMDRMTRLGFWQDDCQVCCLVASKGYTNGLITRPSVHVQVRPAA